MAIVVRNTGGDGDFVPAPAGTHLAVCCDVVDLGKVYNERWGKHEHKIRLMWQINERMENGRLFVVSKRYTASLHEKATLRHHLEAWRGTGFTPAELEGFDLEMLIGVPCLISVLHRAGTTDPTKVFANVMAVMKAPKGQKMDLDPDFVRHKDRPENQNKANSLQPYSTGKQPDVPDEEDIPPHDDDDAPAYDEDEVPF